MSKKSYRLTHSDFLINKGEILIHVHWEINESRFIKSIGWRHKIFVTVDEMKKSDLSPVTDYFLSDGDENIIRFNTQSRDFDGPDVDALQENIKLMIDECKFEKEEKE